MEKEKRMESKKGHDGKQRRGCRDGRTGDI